MSDPTPYNRTYSFTDYQAGNPSAPLPGIQVDNELENVEQSLGEAIDAIKDVRRSDGALKNGIVTVDSLDPTVAAGVGAGALASAQAAAASADAAGDSAVAAAASATAASGSATAASGYASNALTSRNEAETERTLAQTARTGAQTARDYASKWATEAEGVDVDDGVNPVNKSAYHWAQVALAATSDINGVLPITAFGAVPDGDGEGGGTDNSATITAAWEYSIANSVLIYVPAGHIFRCDTPLVYTGAGTFGFVGGGALDFTNCTTLNGFIIVTGPAMTDTQPITATITGPTLTVPVVDASAYSPGDIIRLSTNENYSTDVGSSRNEFAIIDTISGNTITTMNPIVSTYTYGGAPSANRSISKFHPTCRPVFEVSVIGKFGGLTQPQSTPDADQKGIMLYRTAYARYRVDSYHIADRALSISDSVFAMGGGLRVFNADQEGLGYGLVDAGNQWCSFGDIIGHNCRHVTTSGFSQSGGVSRENIFGDISGFGCRDAVVDTHDGACDIKYGNVLGSFKDGNSASDAGVTIQGSRVTMGDVTLTNFYGHGVLIQFQGGDPNREHYYKFGMVDATCRTGATGSIVAASNLSGALAQDIELVAIDQLIGKSSSGILTIPTNGSIKRVSVGSGRITALSNHGIDARSSESGYSRVTCFGLEIDAQSLNTAHYAAYASGVAYTAVNAGKFGSEIELFGCITRNGASTHMRAADGRIEIHGGRQEFSGSGVQYVRSGIGRIRTARLFDAYPDLNSTISSDANLTLTVGLSSPFIRHTGTLTAERSVALSTTGAVEGDFFEITRSGGGAPNLDVGVGPLKEMPTNSWARFRFDGTAWYLAAYGVL